MGNLIRSFLEWYHRQNIRPHIAAAIIGFFGLLLAAVIQGCPQWLSLLLKPPPAGQGNYSTSEITQKGPSNVHAGRDSSIVSLNIQGNVDKLILPGPATRNEEEPSNLHDSFRPLSKALYEKVSVKLKTTRLNQGEVPLRVVISASSEYVDCWKVASQMADLLRSAGFEVKVLSSVIVSKREFAVQAICNSEAAERAKEILMAFDSMLHANIGFQQVPGRKPPEELYIGFRWDPKFLADGTVIFDDK